MSDTTWGEPDNAEVEKLAEELFDQSIFANSNNWEDCYPAMKVTFRQHAKMMIDPKIENLTNVHPMDIDDLLRHAFRAGQKSVIGGFVTSTFKDYDPIEYAPYNRIMLKLYGYV